MAHTPRIRYVSYVLALVFAVAAAGCRKPSAVAEGVEVAMNYTLTVDGKVVDSSEGKPPLRYVQGTKQIIPGLEEALVGLKVGDKKQVTVPPEKGYGALNPNATQKVPMAMFGDPKNLKVGMMVMGQNGGQKIQAKVVKLTSKEVTLDMNHPLAGKTLNFDVEIVEINKAPKKPEIAQVPPPAQPEQPANPS